MSFDDSISDITSFFYRISLSSEVIFTLPEWALKEFESLPQIYPTLEDRVRLVIKFSQSNIDHETGGPFAAAVFEEETGKLVSIGINRVMPLNCSSAHAEIVALSIAQHKLQSFDLGGTGMPSHQLVVNWRPCIMCYGAVIWSGIRSLALASSGPEMEAITGFDEGPMSIDWVEELEKRGIRVIDGVLKDEALKVFQNFKEKGMYVYNSRRG